MDFFVVASAVINTLLTSVNIYCAVRVQKKSVDVDSWGSKLRTLDADVDDLYDRLKRLSSRKGMQALRDERAANPYAKQPNETDAAWKARARKLRNNGVAPTTTEEV